MVYLEVKTLEVTEAPLVTGIGVFDCWLFVGLTPFPPQKYCDRTNRQGIDRFSKAKSIGSNLVFREGKSAY